MTEQAAQSFPITASAGGDNAYYLSYCDAASHRPGYAVCLGKMKINAEDPAQAERRFGECARFMARGNCKAMSMREEELGAGKAIYFISRTAMIKEDEERAAALATPKTKWGTPKRVSPAQAAKMSPVPVLDSGGYADAINAALASKPMHKLVKLPEGFLPGFQQYNEPIAGGFRSRMPTYN